jgi:hypothetical protein
LKVRNMKSNVVLFLLFAGVCLAGVLGISHAVAGSSRIVEVSSSEDSELKATPECNIDGAGMVFTNAGLPYKKFYEKYTFEELSDMSYKYLERVGDSGDGTESQRDWYRQKIERFLEECREAWGSGFSEVVFTRSKTGLDGISLTESQISHLLAMVNDPTNYDWSETTPEFAGRFVFLMQDEVVGDLAVLSQGHVIWPSFELSILESGEQYVMPRHDDFPLMKFGTLDNDIGLAIAHLIGEIEREE